jgi:hypothetical protein
MRTTVERIITTHTARIAGAVYDVTTVGRSSFSLWRAGDPYAAEPECDVVLTDDQTSCDCGTFAGTGTCPHAAALRELRDRGEL